MTELEVWKKIPNHPDYKVSNQGRIKSYKGKTKILKGWISSHGYKMILIDSLRTGVHRIVLMAFIGLPRENQECRHLDGNKLNNHLSNLQWGTSHENAQDRWEHGTMYKGSITNKAILNESQVISIKEKLLNNEKINDLAKQFRVHRNTISNIKHGKAWKWVKIN